MGGIGHNRGPGMGGNGWTRFCWSKARADLFPRLPIEVVRVRVKRAAAIGLDYRVYAGIRATTGHDLAAFLYSTNILRVLRTGEAEAARVAKLAAAQDIRHHLAAANPMAFQNTISQQGLIFDHIGQMPLVKDSERTTRHLLDALRSAGNGMGRTIPASQVLVIGETDLELEWAAIGRLAAAIPATRFFTATAAP